MDSVAMTLTRTLRLAILEQKPTAPSRVRRSQNVLNLDRPTTLLGNHVPSVNPGRALGRRQYQASRCSWWSVLKTMEPSRSRR